MLFANRPVGVPVRSPIFIVGMPRSGTTLVSAMLDAHPDIAISPETHFYTRCRPPGGSAATVDEMWHCLRQQPGFGDARFSAAEQAEMQARIDRGCPSPQPADVLRAVEEVYAERYGAEAWGEKTPDHLQHVPTILQDFPDAAILVVVRDPRDVCLSLKGLPWNRDTLLESAWTWRCYAQATQSYRERFSEQVRWVRYEDLLDDPASVISDVLSWLEAPSDPDLLDTVLHFYEQSGSPADAGREPWKRKTRRPIDPSNQEKWRTQMSRAEQWAVQRLTGPALREMGYDASALRLTPDLWGDLLRLGVDTLAAILRRFARRWAGARASSDYRPDWLREAENGDSSR